MLHHVRLRGVAIPSGEARVIAASQVIRLPLFSVFRFSFFELRASTFVAILLVSCSALPAHSAKLNAPAEAHEGLRLLYFGDADAAVSLFRNIQRDRSAHPLGYLLEANALWWKFYCEACEIRWNMIDAWKRSKLPGDDAYFVLADHAIQLAEAALKTKDSAEMRLYAGMGYALKARLLALRDERLATARAGVKARENFLRALELDPQMADAYTGLGLYNYFADALSGFAKMLRFFLGIPGGSKKEGTRQLELAMRDAELTREEARFYLAKCLRNYDQKYDRAVETMTPLAEQFPRNPLYQLLLGDFYAKLRRNDRAAASLRSAQQAAADATPCAARLQQVARAALSALRLP